MCHASQLIQPSCGENHVMSPEAHCGTEPSDARLQLYLHIDQESMHLTAAEIYFFITVFVEIADDVTILMLPLVKRLSGSRTILACCCCTDSNRSPQNSRQTQLETIRYLFRT